MSRIGDALKRAGTVDLSDGLLDMPLVAEGPEGVAAAPAISEPAPLPSRDSERPTREEAGSKSLEDVIRQHPRLVLHAEAPPMAVEQYRRLAASMHHLQEDRGLKRILVSSALADEGKTLTATNLALTLSESYARRVLLIDADLRRPRVHSIFGLPHGPGLSEALDAPTPQKVRVVRVSQTLSVLPAGRSTPDPMAGLSSSRMAAILEDAAEHFDWVILDTPPVGPLSDARLLAAMADGVLLVVRAGSTPSGTICHAMDAIGRDRLLGVVLNRGDASLASAGEYAYYYRGYHDGPTNENGLSGLLGRFLGPR